MDSGVVDFGVVVFVETKSSSSVAEILVTSAVPVIPNRIYISRLNTAIWFLTRSGTNRAVHVHEISDLEGKGIVLFV